MLFPAWAAVMPAAARTQAAQAYASATVDSNHAVRIRTSDHRTVVLAPDSDQVGVDQVAISPDRRAVGWLALYPNCCTSYPIPLVLEVYARGAVHAFRGIDLPVWRWAFEAGGTQVSLYQETVHGGFGAHYELRDVQSGGLLARYEPSDSTPAPPWVVRLRAAHAAP